MHAYVSIIAPGKLPISARPVTPLPPSDGYFTSFCVTVPSVGGGGGQLVEQVVRHASRLQKLAELHQLALLIVAVRAGAVAAAGTGAR